ncbi:MAG: hypothetical protein WC860_07360 [Candidatus Margulisiibacteriota bacterium]|jgi:hypothetical protein
MAIDLPSLNLDSVIDGMYHPTTLKKVDEKSKFQTPKVSLPTQNFSVGQNVEMLIHQSLQDEGLKEFLEASNTRPLEKL